jgi:integrase
VKRQVCPVCVAQSGEYCRGLAPRGAHWLSSGLAGPVPSSAKLKSPQSKPASECRQEKPVNARRGAARRCSPARSTSSSFAGVRVCSRKLHPTEPPSLIAGIGALLRAIEDYDGLAPLVFVRPGELRKAEWAEFDLEHPESRIPAAKMKMGRLHRVPLSKQALAIIRDLQAISRGGRWLFPSVRSISRPISENTSNAALRWLGYSKGEVTAHDFRGMASTRLNEISCWNPDAIERQLAHQESDDVRRAYMHARTFEMVPS